MIFKLFPAPSTPRALSESPIRVTPGLKSRILSRFCVGLGLVWFTHKHQPCTYKLIKDIIANNPNLTPFQKLGRLRSFQELPLLQDNDYWSDERVSTITEHGNYFVLLETLYISHVVSIKYEPFVSQFFDFLPESSTLHQHQYTPEALKQHLKNYYPNHYVMYLKISSKT